MKGIKALPLLFLALLLALTAVFLAGCGGSGGSSDGENAIEGKSLLDVPEVVNTAKQGASNAARESNLRIIDSAIQGYYVSEGAYPTTVEQMVPTYLKSVPVDQLGGTYYIMSQNGAATAAVR